MKSFLAGILLLTALISCSSSNGGCSDCEPIQPQLVIKPVGEGFKWVGSGVFISIGHSVQWKAELNTSPVPTPLPSDHVTWTATRGVVSETGLFLAPSSPSPCGSCDYLNAVRKDVPNPGVDDRAAFNFVAVALPTIQSFSSLTPMPVAAGAAVTLTFQFADGNAELYTGSTLVQSGLVSGANFTVNPTATMAYILKVTNQAGDSVSKDLTVSVQ